MNLELQDSFVEELVESIGNSWSRVEIHFEYFNWKGSLFEKYVAKVKKNGKIEQFHPSLEALDILIEMNGLTGEDSWTSCDFNLDDSGKYNFSFSYGMPPLVEDMLKNSGELE